ncbi:pentatricopeptide repeat-containing protein [Gossypium australe]|uniref:Pentatricopeptide repeat-containing protein n=1 Tax=Gossypium australe TaxID=47621 RepID=A0A5B6UQ86_9ROSI|nr:pentatricopeptide repeat-containing protein [Gossypium australe]
MYSTAVVLRCSSLYFAATVVHEQKRYDFLSEDIGAVLYGGRTVVAECLHGRSGGNSSPRVLFVGHVSREYAVLYAPGTGVQGKLCTCWIHVWVACGARDTSYEFLGYIRGETATFPMSLRARSVALPCDLVHLVALSWPGHGSEARIFSRVQFSIPEGSHRLCETIENSFLLPLHTFEAKFHLPLHPFFCSLLKEYNVALGQLSGFNWWIVTTYFIDCSRCGEVLLLVQNLLLDDTVAQFQRLRTGCLLVLEDLITTKNVFRYCLEGYIPNGWRLGDSEEISLSVGALSE